MIRWEYCKVNRKDSVTEAFFYDEAGNYLKQSLKHAHLGILLARLGHDGWELVSTRWNNDKVASCVLKRQYQGDWTDTDRQVAKERYQQNYPGDKKY